MAKAVKLKWNEATGEIELQKASNNAVVGAFTPTGFRPGTVAENQTSPGLPIIIPVAIPDAATGDVDVVIDKKMRVTEIRAVKTAGNGASGNTLTVKNGSNAISDALNMNVNDQIVVRAGSINDAYHEIAAGGTLKVSRAKSGGNAAAIVYVEGYLVS